LALAFAPDGRLENAHFTAIDASTIAEARHEVERILNQGLATELKPDGSHEIFTPDGRLYRAVLYQEGGHQKIARIPIAD